jgi:hypothetical protein
MGWTADEFESESPYEQHFSPLHVIQSGSGAHTASYPMDTAAVTPGVKWLGREADHPSPTSAEFSNTWMYTSTPPYTFME